MGRLTETNNDERGMAPKPSMGMSIGANQLLTPAAVRELATVQAQMVVAKSYPRYMPDVYHRVDNLCASPNLAKASTYAYARGGTSINGPTIRLAEALAKAYGNLKYGFEETDSDDRETKVRAYAFDMETNTLAERTFTVPHLRYANKKVSELTDPRDIYEIIANNAQRRVRACILEIIPGDVVDYAMEACQQTRLAHLDKTPESMQNLLDAFQRFNVGKADIEAFIQSKYEAIKDSQWLKLRDIYASLRDGIAKKEDFFKAPVQAGERMAEPMPEPEDAAGDEVERF